MKAFLATTGVIFGLITLAHIWRAFVEGPRLAREPFFIVLTLFAAAMSCWAWWLFARFSRPR